MKYAAEMGSGAMIHILNFIKISSGIQKLMGGYTDTQTAWRSHKAAFIFQNKESRLKVPRNLFDHTRGKYFKMLHNENFLYLHSLAVCSIVRIV
jgi:hypothetical protein